MFFYVYSKQKSKQWNVTSIRYALNMVEFIYFIGYNCACTECTHTEMLQMYVNKGKQERKLLTQYHFTHWWFKDTFVAIAAWETNRYGIKFQVVRLCRSISNDYKSWDE